MTTKFRAQFDGKALIPLDIEARGIGELRPGSPQAILRVMRSLPPIPSQDVDELLRVIEEG